MSSALCGEPNADGFTVHCTEPAGHQGPHSAEGGGPGVVGVAWCTPPTPCRGRSCRGLCHPAEPDQEF